MTATPNPKLDLSSDGNVWNYEATISEIETIVEQIESGELELATVFDQFELAVHHLQSCESFLAERRQSVDLLIETLTDDPA
jgi:exodeoxyribonuclease VII small subunit